MFRRIGLVLVAAGFCVLALGQNTMDPQRDFVVAGKNVYMLLPQTFVCGPSVRSTAWSPDGERLAILRDYADVPPNTMSDLILGQVDPSTLEPETQVIVWSNVTQKATTVLHLKHAAGQIEEVSWIAGSSALVGQGDFAEDGNPAVEHRTTFIINNKGQIITVAQHDAGAELEINPSPYKSIVAMIEHPMETTTAGDVKTQTRLPATIRFFGVDGVLSERISFPAVICIPFWSNDGQLYVKAFEKADGSKKYKQNWYLIDREGKKCLPATIPPPDASQMMVMAGPTEIAVQDLSPKVSVAKLGISAPTVILTPSDIKDASPTVITTDGSKGDLSPTKSAVTYQSQGSVMVRPMVKVSLEAYQKARDAAIKAKIIAQAKQVALAMIMYANDYDDVYPGHTNWQTNIDPYLKNQELTSGFNYTFGGGSATSIANPAETVLGYIDGPGGRAVAYTDGHVKWIPNP